MMKRFKEMLESGRPVIGTSILYESPEIIESLIGQGWDWIWLDGQHVLRQHTWLEHIRACQLINSDSVLRVPSSAGHFIGHGLDLGVWNIMVPMVESAEQAYDVVQAAHFPPLGSRSAVGSRPIFLYGWEYIEIASQWVTVIVQIETRAGMEHLDEIAAVPGVNAFLIGTGDLCLSLGIPLSERGTSPVIEEAIQGVGRAARQHGKYAGIICPPEDIPKRMEQGYSFFSLSMSADIISGQMSQTMKKARQYIGNE
jgi:2-keto-3-deoxy-L-rhamnonate aldolase RhmA